MSNTTRLAVLGRFCPTHKGHMGLIDYAVENSPLPPLVVIGSSNAPISYRNMFTYTQRREWLCRLYGSKLFICGAPDFPYDDVTWARHLRDTVELLHENPNDVAFIGGCQEDLHYLRDGGFQTRVAYNRYQGQKLSASEVRDALIRKATDAELQALLPEKLVADVRTAFDEQWNKLRKV